MNGAANQKLSQTWTVVKMLATVQLSEEITKTLLFLVGQRLAVVGRWPNPVDNVKG